MPRPPVDVVVPFAGAASELEATLRRLAHLRLGPADTLVVVDNRPPNAEPVAAGDGRARLVRAPELQSPAFARNRGASGGTGEWLVFIDADADAPPDLVERYLEPAPPERAGILGGAVLPAPPAPGQRETLAQRFARLRGHMSQELTMDRGRWSFAQTVNCAVRRSAFDAVGGFRAELRAGEDADLCFRLAAQGWKLESRYGAVVLHRHRRTLRRLLAQCLQHGAASAWLDREYPGSFPARRWPGLAWWSLRRTGEGVAELARGERDAALLGLLDPPTVWAFELGRLRSNAARRESSVRVGRATPESSPQPGDR